MRLAFLLTHLTLDVFYVLDELYVLQNRYGQIITFNHPRSLVCYYLFVVVVVVVVVFFFFTRVNLSW